MPFIFLNLSQNLSATKRIWNAMCQRAMTQRSAIKQVSFSINYISHGYSMSCVSDVDAILDSGQWLNPDLASMADMQSAHEAWKPRRDVFPNNNLSIGRILEMLCNGEDDTLVPIDTRFGNQSALVNHRQHSFSCRPAN